MTTQAADDPRFRIAKTSPEELIAALTPVQIRAHLQALQGLTESILAHLTLPELLRELLSRLRATVSVDTATVLLCAEGGGSLVVRASNGLEEEVDQQVEIPVGHGIAGTVAVRRQAVIVDDVSAFETASPLLRRLSSMMVAPLLAEGELLGVLHVGSITPRRFTAPELYLLQVVADRVALAIRNALTFDRQQEEARQRARAEAALAHSEVRYQSFFESNPDPVFALDAEGRFIAFNAAAAAVSGYAAEEAIGRSFRFLVKGDQAQQALDAFQRALAGHSQLFETVITTRDGERRQLRVTAIPAYEEGVVAGVFGVAEDVTDQRRAENAVREHEARLGAILSQSTAGIAEVDLAGRFTSVNDRFCEILGRTRADVLELGMQDVTHPEDLPGNVELFRRLVAGGPDFAIEKRYVRPDGTEVWVHNSVLGVRGPDGALRFLVAVVEDISDRKRAEAALREHAEQLQDLTVELEESVEEAERRVMEADAARREADEANRARSDFLAVMSHELRTPLNAIMGYAQLLAEGVPEPVAGGSLRQVERIQAAARHLLSLIEDVLSFARIEAGREVLGLQVFDAREPVREEAARIEPLARARELEVHTRVPDGPLSMTSDPGKVRQILAHLLDNAVKFTAQGEVEVRAWAENGAAYFQVRDTGPGIATEHRDRIFEPFWQSDQSRTRTAEGTGMGLAVVQRTARVLGGEVTVESEPGKGATFTVRLPLAPPPQGAEAPEARNG